MNFSDLVKNGEYELKVPAEQLGAASIRQKELFDEILGCINDIKACIKESPFVWNSKSSEVEMDRFSADFDSFEDTENRILKHIAELEPLVKMSGENPDTNDNALCQNIFS